MLFNRGLETQQCKAVKEENEKSAKKFKKKNGSKNTQLQIHTVKYNG